jgi:hypothetical protein
MVFAGNLMASAMRALQTTDNMQNGDRSINEK